MFRWVQNLMTKIYKKINLIFFFLSLHTILRVMAAFGDVIIKCMRDKKETIIERKKEGMNESLSDFKLV